MQKQDDRPVSFNRLGQIGTALFVVSMAFFGVQLLVFASGLRDPNPMSPWTVTSRGWAGLVGVVALAGSIGLATSHARVAATLLAVLAFARALVYIPDLTWNVRAEGNWTNAFQLLAWCGVCLVLADTASVAPTPKAGRRPFLATVTRVGCLLFASSLPVFGVEHLVSARDIAPMVPSWIPWHLFWTYFAGVAFFAAAAAMATQIQARLGGTMLGVMFLLWVLVLWLPAIAANPRSEDNWTNAVITLAMSGGAFLIAALATVPAPGTAHRLPVTASDSLPEA